MSDKNKYLKKSSSDFLRYKRGEMTAEERNAFEKELQKDPFAYEAADGLDSLTPEESLHDFLILKNNIISRTSRRRGFSYYRIAATVAVLMVISSIFILVEKENRESRIAEPVTTPESFEITEGEAIKYQVAKNSEVSEIGEISAKKSSADVTRRAEKEIIQSANISENKDVAKQEVTDSISDAVSVPIEFYLTGKDIAAPSAIPKAKSFSLSRVSGIVISSDDNLPVPGASINVKGTASGVITDASGNFSITMPDTEKRTLVASFIGMESKEFEVGDNSKLQIVLDPSLSSLSEVIVVGYGVKRDEEINSGYVTPQPVIGRTAFNKYIEDNIERPDTITSGQRAVVVINFTVLSNGNIDSIKIIRSPGKAFSDEAIRLIKSGPQWKPAEENGKVIDDDVRLRIIFR